MLHTFAKCVRTVVAAGALVYGLVPLPARAQSSSPVVLPTAPGADRAVSGGLSAAHASLPGGPGLSPLEPYLILWLLPASGLVTVFAGLYADRRTQAQAARSRLTPGRARTSVGRSQ